MMSEHEIEAEMQDRFGPIPEVVYHLFELMAIKYFLKKLKVASIDFGNERVVIKFSDQTPVQPDQIIKMVEKDPKTYRLSSSNKFVVKVDDWKKILPMVRQFVADWILV